jgi:cell division protein FtsB
MKRLGYILFALIIIYFIFLIRQDIIDNLELKREVRQVAGGIKREEQLARELKQRLADLRTNKYIEKLARIRLGLVKKGETAYKVIQD